MLRNEQTTKFCQLLQYKCQNRGSTTLMSARAQCQPRFALVYQTHLRVVVAFAFALASVVLTVAAPASALA